MAHLELERFFLPARPGRIRDGCAGLILTLLGGMLADRRDRTKVVIFLFQAIQMCCPVFLILLILTATLHVWMIIALSLVVGITDALSMPALQSIAPSIVDPGQIGTAIALNSTQFNLSRVLGPAIAGLVMARFGPAWCFGANALSYIPLLFTVYWIQAPRKVDRRFAMSSGQSWFAEIHKIARQPRLLGALCTVLVTSILCGPLIAFSPTLIKDVFRSDAVHFGQAIAAFGVGGLIGATGILAIERHFDRVKLCSRAAVLYGLLLSLVAMNRSLTLLSCLLVLCGAAMTVSNTLANSILQYTAHDRIRGRTSSLYMLAMRGGAITRESHSRYLDNLFRGKSCVPDQRDCSNADPRFDLSEMGERSRSCHGTTYS